jgi:organic hydroperoxide reductase OsmC/OhrA
MSQPSAVAATERPKAKAEPFPHDYEVSLHRGDDGVGVLEAGSRPVIVAGLPPQFGGDAEKWSPEHLLLSAVSLCLMNTFQVFVAKKELAVRSYSSVVKGILDKTPAGLAFTSIVVVVELSAPHDQLEEAKQVLENAKHYCIVANTLKTPVDLRIVATPA